MLWVGIPFAVLIIGYSLYLIKLVFLSIQGLPQLYLFMMVACILVHAQLEYPLYYSYFLFPLGFFIGILLIDCNCKYFLLNEKFKHIIFLISICFYALIFKQYDQWLSDLGYVSGMENTGKSKHKKSILFSQFSDRADFIVARIDQNYTRSEFEFFEYYVKTQPTEYNLYKMAQIFYFNEDMNRANYYLEVYNSLYNKKALFKDLSKINTNQGIGISSLFEKNSSKPNLNMK
nr:Wzy polymerase domain-containing protein [Acinetobacter sp. YH12027]